MFNTSDMGKPWRVDSKEQKTVERLGSLRHEPEYWELAACSLVADQDLFFPRTRPSHEQKKQIRKAKEYCAACPITERCLDYAMTNSIYHGIWGGMTVPERIRLRKLKQWVNQTL